MRSDAYIRVTCDCCGDEVEVGLEAIACNGWDERNVNAHLRRLEWTTGGDDKDYCDECSRLRAEEMENQ
jgi:hypothetical protein